MCSDDGPSNRWIGVYSLGYQPSAYHTALPTPQSLSIACTPTPVHHPSHISSLLFHSLLLCYSLCPTSYSFPPHLDLFHSLYFSSSIPPGRNGFSAKLRPNPLIFPHVSARAAIPLFLRPLLLCWANGQCSDPRLPATRSNISSKHV